MRIGVVGHLGYDGLDELVAHIIAVAPGLGLSVEFEPSLRALAGDDATLIADPAKLDGLVAFGGDGTLLRGARLLDGASAPIFGVNLGKLGFLTTCGGEEFPALLPRFARGDFSADSRMALEAQARGPDGVLGPRLRALNDVVLHKGGFARVLRLHVTVNGDHIGSLAADGIVISTPTGSTAYSLSAGGPIVVPTLDSILVTPVAAHALAIRPFILPPDSVLEVQPDDAPEEVLVTVDGQVGTSLGSGHTLTIHRASHPVHIVRFDDVSFFARLRAKMGWGGLAYRDK
jgi:NAD+ kinase